MKPLIQAKSTTRPGQERWTIKAPPFDSDEQYQSLFVFGPPIAPGQSIPVVPASLLTQAEEERDEAKRKYDLSTAHELLMRLEDMRDRAETAEAASEHKGKLAQHWAAQADELEAQLARAEGVGVEVVSWAIDLSGVSSDSDYDEGYRQAQADVLRRIEKHQPLASYFNPQPGEEGDADERESESSRGSTPTRSTGHVTEGPSTEQHGRSLSDQRREWYYGRGPFPQPEKEGEDG